MTTFDDLSALGATPADTDDLLLRDVSDTTDAGTGTHKLVTRANLLGDTARETTTDVSAHGWVETGTLTEGEDTKVPTSAAVEWYIGSLLGTQLSHASEHGAVGDGVTDDTAALNAAAGTGAAVFLDTGATYGITDTILVDGDHYTSFSTLARGGKYIFANSQSRAHIKWIGTSGAENKPMLHFRCPTTNAGATFTERGVGGGLDGVVLNVGDATNHALEGLRLTSWAAGDWNFGVFNLRAGSTGVILTTHADAGATQGDCQENHFRRVNVNANGVSSARCVALTAGAAGSNTSFNLWDFLSMKYTDGHGLVMEECDAETFVKIRGNQVAGSTGRCVMMRAKATAVQPRYITFVDIEPGAGGVEMEGTGVAANAPLNIAIDNYALGNGSVAAVWGTGATGHITYHDGSREIDGISTTDLNGRVQTLSADVSYTSTTTVAEVTDFTLASAPLNSVWLMEAWLHVASASNTGDLKLQVAAGASPTGWVSVVGPTVAATLSTGEAVKSGVHGIGDTMPIGVETTQGSLIRLYGHITKGATGGTLIKLNAAQNTSDASATTLKAGSWVKYTRLS